MPLDKMRLSLSQRTAEEQRELIWLRALESGDTTFADLMSITGLKRSHLYERLKRARENRPIEDEPVRESRGADELPWVELAYGVRSGLHYRLDRDAESVLPPGPFRVGDHNGRRLMVARSGDGAKVEQPTESKHKFKPKARKKSKRAG